LCHPLNGSCGPRRRRRSPCPIRKVTLSWCRNMLRTGAPTSSAFSSEVAPDKARAERVIVMPVDQSHSTDMGQMLGHFQSADPAPTIMTCGVLLIVILPSDLIRFSRLLSVTAKILSRLPPSLDRHAGALRPRSFWLLAELCPERAYCFRKVAQRRQTTEHIVTDQYLAVAARAGADAMVGIFSFY